MRAPRVVARQLVAAAALVCLPIAAEALPVTYNWSSATPSSVTITATAAGSPIGFNGSPSLTIALTGSSFTFDTALVPLANNDGSIVSFTFITAPTGAIAITGGGPVTSLTLGAITVANGAGFQSASTGTGPYNFTMSGTTGSGTYTTNLGGPTAFSGPVTGSAFGSVTLGVNTIRVQDITIASLSVAGIPVLVKGDFVFHGVPEPGTVALFLVGAIAIGAELRRR